VELDTFTNDRNSHGPRPDLAALRGMRMVVIEEVDDRQTGVVGLLKKVSGGTSIATRSLYQETFNFKAQFKAWLLGNKRPRFPDDDSGLWRRLSLLPFIHVFVNPDTAIRTTLSTDSMARSRVLNWSSEGYLLLQQEGLAQPPIVQEATGEYRSDLDPLNDWLIDNTITLAAAWTSFNDLYGDYRAWTLQNGVRGVLGSKSFSQRLATRFAYAKAGHAKTRGFSGIGLKTGFQIRADTSEVFPMGKVPETFLNQSYEGHFIQPQIAGNTSEVSANLPGEGSPGLDQEVSADLRTRDPWDEGWQDSEEARL